MTAEAESGHQADVGLAGTEVINNGTFVLNEPTAGTAAAVIGNGATFVNKGVIDAQAAQSTDVNHLEANLTNAPGATLEVKSGELRQDNNTTTTNEGTLQIDGGASFGATSSADLVVNKGSLTNGGSVYLSNNASWTQEAGAASETGSPVFIRNAGMLTDVSGGGSFDLVDGPTLSGKIPAGQSVTAEAEPGHNAVIHISGTVSNEGTLALNSPSTGGTPELMAASSSSQIDNSGALTAQSASASAGHVKVALTNQAAGSLEVKTGELRQDNNTKTTNEGSFKVESGASFGATSSADLVVNKGSLTNGGSVYLSNNASWTQEAGAASETGSPVFIRNAGMLTDVSGGGSFDLVDSAKLSGTIPTGQTVTAEAESGHQADVGLAGTEVINNGTFVLNEPTAGTAAAVIGNGATFVNKGVIDAQAAQSTDVNHLEANLTNAPGATLEVKSGELRQDNNTTTTNEGTLQIDGGASFGATSSADLVVNKAKAPNGVLDNGAINLTNNASWTQNGSESGHPVFIHNAGMLTDEGGGGSFDLVDSAKLSGTIPTGQTVTAEAESGHQADVGLAGTEVINNGTFVLNEPTAGTAAAVIGNGATFVNKGVIDAQAAQSTDVNHLEANLTNAPGATLEVKSGELRQDNNTTTTNEGTLQIDGGASFGATSSADLVVNKANGTLQPDIASATSFGALKVSNGATFTPGGTILPNLVGGYAPPVGTEFDVIEGTTPISGAFSTVANNFLGDYSKASSSPSIIAVKRDHDSTATALAAQPTATTYGQSVTLTATITTGPGAVTSPTGTVKFLDGGKPLAEGTLSTSGGVTSASYTTTLSAPLSVGTHSITASYEGDPNFKASETTESASETVAKGTSATTLEASSLTPTLVSPSRLLRRSAVRSACCRRREERSRSSTVARNLARNRSRPPPA